MKKPLLLIWAFLVVGWATAQTTDVQTKNYTMKDAVVGLYLDLSPERIDQTKWIPGEDAFTKVDYSGDDLKLIRVEVPSMKESTLFSLSELKDALFKESRLGRFPEMHWMDNQHLYFQLWDDLYLIDRSSGTWEFKLWTHLPGETDNLYVDKSQHQVAFSVGNNLHFTGTDGIIHMVTNIPNEEIVSGQIVSRHEFGIEKGVYFSPKGNFIAYYQKDESKVKDYPVIDWSVTPAENHNVKYPMAGGDSELVSVKIYDPKTKKTVQIQADKDEDDYLTNVSWSPDEKSIFVGVFKRNQKHLTLNQYDVQTGKKIRQILEEKDDKYVHPADPLYFIPGKDDEFIWTSERSGFMHLYRYNTQGKLLNQLTSGDWIVQEIAGWIPKKKRSHYFGYQRKLAEQ